MAVSTVASNRVKATGALVLAVLVAVLIVAAATAGSVSKAFAQSNNGFAPQQLQANGLPKLKFKGTITFAADSYSPAIPGVKLAPGAVASTAMQNAANQFHKMYPGIKIKFVPTTAQIGTSQWYITESAAGTLPDVSFVPGYYVNVTLPKGLYQNLQPSFQQPNPFIPGNKKWISTMNSAALKSDTVVGTQPGTTGIYVVNGDWAGIGFWYNEDLFKQAGINTPPSSFNQLVADSRQLDTALKPQGIYAGASAATVIYNWFAHWFEPNFLGLKRVQQIWAGPPNAAVGQEYFYSHGGNFMNPSDNPELTAWFPLGKELTDTWAPKDVQVTENSTSAPSGSEMLLGKQVAYCFCQGYSLPAQVAALPKSQQFPLGYFNLTSFKGSSKYATNLQVWQNNGGPAVGFQYGIASPQADNSMNPTKAAAARAWLQFISTPTEDADIVNGLGTSLPIIKGAKAPAALEPTLKAINAASKFYYPMASFDSITNSSFATIDGLYLEYIGGFIPLSQAKSEYDSDAAQIMAQWTAKNQPLLTAYGKWYAKHHNAKGQGIGGAGNG